VLLLAVTLLQVSVRPPSVVPTRHERFAVQVANPTDTAIVAVRVDVPEVLVVLGVESPPGWTARIVAGTPTTSQAIEWEGGALGERQYQDFAFLARLPADARRTPLVFPVRASFAGGAIREWRTGGVGPAPEVAIRGTVGVTAGGAFVLAAGAFGVAVLALALALRRPR
jgi:uncharacterized protein YcnI